MRSHSAYELTAHEVTHSHNLEEVTFSTHEIALVHNERESRDHWDGKNLPSKIWKRGAVSFLPKESRLRSTLSPGDHRETLITINDSLFERMSAGLIDSRCIDFRYADVTSPELTHIASAVRQIVTIDAAMAWPILVHSVSVALAAALIRQLSPIASIALNEKKPGLSRDRKRRLMEFMRANLTKPIGLHDLSKVAGLSKHHLIRSFKAEFGLTPYRWLLQERIIRAKILLATSMPMAEVAYSCGFSSQSHFCTTFKEVTGMTPSSYRRSKI